MKLLVVTTSFPRYQTDFAGGFIAELIMQLKQNHDVDPMVIAPHDSGLAKEDCLFDIPIKRFVYAPQSMETLAYHGGLAIKSTSLRYYTQVPIFIAAMIAHTLRFSKDVDIIHAQWLLSAIAAMVAGNVRNTPYIVTAHGSDVNLLKYKWQINVARTILRNASAIIAVSPKIKERLLKISSEAKVYYIPNGISERFISEPKIPDDKITVGYAGRLVKEKGVIEIITALKGLENVDLHIAGTGPLETYIQTLANKWNNIHYLGSIPPENMPRFYRNIDIFVLPSQMEGMPMTVLEAMASGKVVVASAVGGIPEALEHGKCGILLRDNEPTTIRRAIESLSTDRNRYIKLATNAYERAVKEYSIKKTAQKVFEIYKSVISRK